MDYLALYDNDPGSKSMFQRLQENQLISCVFILRKSVEQIVIYEACLDNINEYCLFVWITTYDWICYPPTSLLFVNRMQISMQWQCCPSGQFEKSIVMNTDFMTPVIYYITVVLKT